MNSSRNLLNAILITGFIAGTLDALAAMFSAYIQHDVTPDRVFRYVASGVFGKEAFSGGTPMALFGLLCHYTVAFGWSALFLTLFQKIKLLNQNKYIIGMAYGLFVLLAMNLIVVPLSNVPNSKPGSIALPQIFIHMFLVGLPIALSANYFLKKQSA
jgi:hypothetical protein